MDEHPESAGRREARRRWLASLASHHHDPGDRLDEELTTSALGIRTTKLTLVVLMATAAAQLAIAIVSGSVALLADTIHNVADALTSIPLWIAFVIGRRARTQRYPYGYRRAEDLSGLFIVLVIAASAVWIGWESVGRLIDPEPMTHTGWVFLAGCIGVAGNELAAVMRIRVGRRIGSAALVADGHHARTDTLASLAVIVAVIGTWLGLPLLDPIVGLAITAVIVWILKDTTVQVLRRLMDSVEPSVLTRISTAAGRVEGVESVGAVRARWSGHRLLADLTVSVAGQLTTVEAHEIAEHVRHELLHRIDHLEDAWVHVNPTPDGERDPHHVTAHHREELGPAHDLSAGGR